LLGGRLVHREPSPVVRLAGMSWDEFLSSRSRNFRQQLQRCERRLSRHDGYRIRLANDPDLLERDMQILMSLHDARWAASETRAFAARRRAIHLEWAAVALARGWLRLWLMEVGGTPIAAWYGFRYGGAEWYYQSGRDPAWSRESAGFVLMCHSIQAAMHDGATEYRMLRGGEAYKARFTSDNPDIDTIVLGNSLVARSAAVAAMLAKSLPSSARHRLSNAIG
jgi:CelD/BcsL family acetyltransferase involved in cellulose biosynthesis